MDLTVSRCDGPTYGWSVGWFAGRLAVYLYHYKCGRNERRLLVIQELVRPADGDLTAAGRATTTTKSHGRATIGRPVIDTRCCHYAIPALRRFGYHHRNLRRYLICSNIHNIETH